MVVGHCWWMILSSIFFHKMILSNIIPIDQSRLFVQSMLMIKVAKILCTYKMMILIKTFLFGRSMIGRCFCHKKVELYCWKPTQKMSNQFQLESAIKFLTFSECVSIQYQNLKENVYLCQSNIWIFWKPIDFQSLCLYVMKIHLNKIFSWKLHTCQLCLFQFKI